MSELPSTLRVNFILFPAAVERSSACIKIFKILPIDFFVAFRSRHLRPSFFGLSRVVSRRFKSALEAISKAFLVGYYHGTLERNGMT